MAKYNEKGQELPDQTPVELPIGYKIPETLTEMIARMVRIHSVAALKQELESFEDADDFETDENEEPTSSHQMTQMEEDQPRYKPSILKTDRRGSDQEKKPPAEPAEPAAALTKK